MSLTVRVLSNPRSFLVFQLMYSPSVVEASLASSSPVITSQPSTSTASAHLLSATTAHLSALTSLHPLLASAANPSEEQRPTSPTQEMLEKARAREVVLVRKGKLRQCADANPPTSDADVAVAATTPSQLSLPGAPKPAVSQFPNDDPGDPVEQGLTAAELDPSSAAVQAYLDGRNIIVQQKGAPETLKYFVQFTAPTPLPSPAPAMTKREVEEMKQDFILANEELPTAAVDMQESEEVLPLISVSPETLHRFRALINRLEPVSRASLTPTVIYQILANLQAAGGRLDFECNAEELQTPLAAAPIEVQAPVRSQVVEREVMGFAPSPVSLPREANLVQKSPLKKRPVSYRLAEQPLLVISGV